jgi:Rrf2 family protein
VRLSSLADYAVVMMSAAARHCGSAARIAGGSTKRDRVSATDLAAETGIPLPTAQKLVSLLTRARLLKSARGTGGGITLARPSAAISLADIIEAVEGPIAMASCVDTTKRDCTMEGNCAVQPHWPAVNAAVKGALGGISLASIATKSVPPTPNLRELA